jgi:hypothetical protein
VCLFVIFASRGAMLIVIALGVRPDLPKIEAKDVYGPLVVNAMTVVPLQLRIARISDAQHAY